MIQISEPEERNRTFRVGPIRPPSEADSLLLQVTNGCTWNKCRFCTIYKDTTFKAFSADSVKQDIDTIAAYAQQVRAYRSLAGLWDIDGLNEHLSRLVSDEERQCFYMVANWLLRDGENVFLQDGNTTALSSGRLSDVLIYLKQVFPQIKRITSYGRAENLSRHDAAYFAELKEAGLDRIHSGYESGSDEVLQLINKGVTSEQEIRAGRNIKAGGIELSIYFMPGIGGKDLTVQNSEGTARVIREVQPDFLRIRTAAIKPGTELYGMYESGDYSLCSDDDKVREIRRVIELTEGVTTTLVSDHMVNLLQEVNGSLSGNPGDSDRAEMLQLIDDYFAMPETDRRVFQLLRRTLRAYSPSDLENLTAAQWQQLRDAVRDDPPDVWDAKMNDYICRYI
ncbi:MAG: radical SAM protein [Firmicutes bacterium]|nr:radical SAM protein [Bacillota bacterium]